MVLFRSITLVLLSMCVSGCLPLSVYYREGAEVSRIAQDETQCEVDALRQVPVRTLTRYIPPVYDYRKICNSAGACSTTRILIRPGRWESYDANVGLRSRVAEQCMISKGYEKVRVQPCPSSVIQATTITATRVQPPLTSASCAIRIRGDKYQIVTPQ